jgi:hypothetical protein
MPKNPAFFNQFLGVPLVSGYNHQSENSVTRRTTLDDMILVSVDDHLIEPPNLFDGVSA